MTALKEIAYFYQLYHNRLGYKMYMVFAFTFITALLDTFGIALLLPLITEFDPGTQLQGTDTVTKILNQFLGWIGVQSVPGILLFIGGVFLVKGGVKWGAGAYSTILSTDLQRELKTDLYNRYQQMRYGYYSSQNTGHFLNILIWQIHKFISGFFSFKSFLSKIIITSIYLIIVFLMAWQFALMALAAGLLYLVVFGQLNNVVKRLSKKTSAEYSELNKQAVEQLHSFKYLVATHQFGNISHRVLDSVEKLCNYARKYGLLKAFAGSVKEPISIFLLIVIVIIQLTVFQGTVAPIVVSLILINRAMGKIMSLQSSWLSTISHIGPIEMVENELQQLKQEHEKDGNVHVPSLSGGIEFRNVVFGHDRDVPPLFNGLNIDIKAKKMTAIVGESGAGKSTIIDLLCLLHTPWSGEILIDNISLQDVYKASWRSQIGYVTQDSVLFDDTILANITLTAENGNQQVEQARIAALQAGILEFIDTLPNKFSTQIGDRGIRLSGGQKQRLSIARELYRKPQLLILDEATSALDSETENIIQESISSLKNKVTIVIISHRLSTIKQADYIYVLRKGRIYEKGTYNELMHSGNKFAEMVGSQNSLKK